MTSDFIVNHLWQCSWFTVAAAALSFVLHAHSPTVRHWIWVIASLKFLVPFAFLVALGSAVGSLVPWPRAATMTRIGVIPDAVAFVAEPLLQDAQTLGSRPAATDVVPLALGIVWAIGFAAIVVVRCRQMLDVRAVLRTGTPVTLPIQIPAVVVAGTTGPGVVGVVRPILMLPAALLDRLTPKQLDAVLAHEWSHVRRRDNLFAAIHMVVETVFWFHPFVWWIGSRMVEARERACDEDVLARGSAATDYVEGILTVCRLHTEFELSCVAGVAGADVKRRVRAILDGRSARDLSTGKKAVLASLGLLVIAAPIGVGLFSPSSARAQSLIVASDSRPRPRFEVASVKSVDRALMTRDHEGRQLTTTRFVDRTDLLQYIVRAYVDGGGCQLKTALGQDCPVIVGSLPAWVGTERWEIQATLPPGTPTYSAEQRRERESLQVNLMLQVLLEDRFRLAIHRETRELPVYVLVVGKSGPKLKPTPPGGEFRKAADGRTIEVHGMAMMLRVPRADGSSSRRMTFQASSMQDAAEYFASYFDRPVLDRTGVSGNYDFTLESEFDADAPGPVAVPNLSGRGGGYFNPFTGLTAAGLSASLRDVGLSLESTRAPLEVLVVDRVEKPTEN
jgi:bla regulator protein blaR1